MIDELTAIQDSIFWTSKFLVQQYDLIDAMFI